jgi:hypothetical protein
MHRAWSICIASLLLVSLGDCRHQKDAPQNSNPEHYISDSASVGFDISALPSENGDRQWRATYISQGKTAKFRIEIGRSTPAEKGDDGFNFTSGAGKLISEPGSDPSILIADLKKALEANHLPAKTQRSSSLPFTYVILGEHNSQAEGGGFAVKPPGNWTAMKIFIGSGEQIGTSEEIDEGEVFLNFNPISGKAQFSEKDKDYGDYVLAKLATVL